MQTTTEYTYTVHTHTHGRRRPPSVRLPLVDQHETRKNVRSQHSYSLTPENQDPLKSTPHHHTVVSHVGLPSFYCYREANPNTDECAFIPEDACYGLHIVGLSVQFLLLHYCCSRRSRDAAAFSLVVCFVVLKND